MFPDDYTIILAMVPEYSKPTILVQRDVLTKTAGRFNRSHLPFHTM